ncbi:LamB/YcsF family protein [Rhodococcus sp. KBS0724]|uniref:LamB/YcsF family protein n=1 Tax=Rhodococcus sp. KBS0724 TaxID=1179674 RepID=UPI00110F6696|nr:5-oxoprolinase subunit PxpA [Rhodococcus sp. KBS0724]TSD40402.1 LamB/YcsF family protein [Rhodococcus sp. KBS0724]
MTHPPTVSAKQPLDCPPAPSTAHRGSTHLEEDAVAATFDLNADLGEGFGPWRSGDDQSLLAVISSANIACGFHAGDPSIMRKVCGWAADRGVVIGAHVGYRDLVGFGRRAMTIDPDDLCNETVYQLAALDGFACAAGTNVRYLKPHGALYHAAANNADTARALLDAVTLYNKDLAILGPSDSWLQRVAADEYDIRFVAEGFADRAYTELGTLVDRRRPGAVLHDRAAICTQVLDMARHSTVRSIDGTVVDVDVASVCVHGDTADATDIARSVKHALEGAGIEIRAFA